MELCLCRDHTNKKSEVMYTCSYASGHLIHTLVLYMTEVDIKCPLV